MQRLWLPTFIAPADPRLGWLLQRRYPPLRGGERWRIGFEARIDALDIGECINPDAEGSGWFRLDLQTRPLNARATRWWVEAEFDLEWLGDAAEEAAARGRVRHADPAWRPETLSVLLCELLLRPADHSGDRGTDLRRLRLRRLPEPPSS